MSARSGFGPGWRMYYVQRGATLVVMLGGGEKSTQAADIAKAIVAKLELRNQLRPILNGYARRSYRPERMPAISFAGCVQSVEVRSSPNASSNTSRTIRATAAGCGRAPAAKMISMASTR